MTAMMTEPTRYMVVPVGDKTLLRWDDIVKRLGVSRTKVYSMMRMHGFPPGFSIGRTRFWRAEDIERWADIVAIRKAGDAPPTHSERR